MEETTVYDEAIERVAEKMGLTVQQVDDVMSMYHKEAKNIHIERGHIKTGSTIASKKRTKVD